VCDISRRQLTPVFDKPAFSRVSQNCEPLIVVEIVGKIVKMQVCQNGGELPSSVRYALLQLWTRKSQKQYRTLTSRRQLTPVLTNLPFHDFPNDFNHY